MMKELPQDAFNGFANAKCGEIFCQSSTSFSIICTFCKMKSFKFDDFLLHVKNVHFDNDLLKTNDSNMPTDAAASAEGSGFITPKQECMKEEKASLKMTPTTTTKVFGGHHENINDWFIKYGDNNDSDVDTRSYGNNIKAHNDQNDDNNIDAGDNIEIAAHNELTAYNINNNVFMDANPTNRIINWLGETTKAMAQKQQSLITTRLMPDRQCNLKKKREELIKEKMNSDTESDADNIEEDQISDKEDKPYKPMKPPPPRQYKCDFCSKIYVTKGSQVQHMRREHDVLSTTTCNECKTDLPSQRQHDQHVIQQHGGFLCGHCTKRYKCRRDLQRHEIKHTGERSIVCDFEGCDKRFFTVRNMQSHRKIHTLEKNFVCENCGYSCRTKYTLRVHLRMHTGEKPFACKDCPKRFPSHSGLREHITMHSTARPHVCTVCNASFARQKALYHHKFLHSETKKFICKICGNAYAQQSGLAGHVRKHKEGVL